MEYATREQAQNAVNTLSNQNLMGRLVYVREVSIACLGLPFGSSCVTMPNRNVQDREAEPRFIGQGGGNRGQFGGSMGGPGGYSGGGGYGGGPSGMSGSRQIYVSNVCLSFARNSTRFY